MRLATADVNPRSKVYLEKMAEVKNESRRKDLNDLLQCGFDDFGLNQELLDQYKTLEEVGGLLQRMNDLK